MMVKFKGQFKFQLGLVAFLWNFFISREAATAERRYEKERQSVNYMHTASFGARTNLFSPLPALPLPLSHPPPINAIRGAGLRLFPPPPPHTPWGLWPVSGDLGQNRGWPPFRCLEVLQLNLASNCDYVRIFGAVIGHLEAELDFWIFDEKWWKPRRVQ